jgi:hypothetical protein
MKTIDISKINKNLYFMIIDIELASTIKHSILTPKGPRPFFGPFLKFRQAIVNAIFVQKI